MRACVIGANICRTISLCFSQNGAEAPHRLMTSWSGCMSRSIDTSRHAAAAFLFQAEPCEVLLFAPWTDEAISCLPESAAIYISSLVRKQQLARCVRRIMPSPVA
jgi:hypothetical protein